MYGSLVYLEGCCVVAVSSPVLMILALILMFSGVIPVVGVTVKLLNWKVAGFRPTGTVVFTVSLSTLEYTVAIPLVLRLVSVEVAVPSVKFVSSIEPRVVEKFAGPVY
ncbi:hypothetical protein [Methanothermobacter sp.]|uniref:hypothetical protein n=1 Tax=Methanothermobacter sp. TaxID=1884223 RepID=UPI0026225E0F|nr:hypothetical protein [Methanothermobacter sp.]MDI9618827.1 hypothetical protein [Methanothermobacter sp.]